MSDDAPRPRDLYDVPLSQLLTDYYEHLSALVNARSGVGDPLSPEQLARYALDALATGQALADQILAARWVEVVDALANGASVAQAAAACGLDEIEVTVGLHSWADSQRREELMSPAEHAEVLGLVEGWPE